MRITAEDHIRAVDRLDYEAMYCDVTDVPDPRPGAKPASTIPIWKAIRWHTSEAKRLSDEP